MRSLLYSQRIFIPLGRIYIYIERESPFYVSIYLIRFTNTFGFLIKKLETEDEMT